MRRTVAGFGTAKWRRAGWMLLVLVSWMVEGASLADTPASTVIIIAKADKTSHPKEIGAMGFCIPMMRDGGTGFEPSMDVYYYHFNEKNKLFSDSYEIEPLVQLVRSPRHGVLTTDRHKKDVDSWFYTPEKGYLGNDQAEFLVEVEDVLVRLVYIFRVTNLNPDSDSGEALGVCKKSQWIISQPSLEASVAPIPLS